VTPTEEIQQRLADHRTANSARRARAFCDGMEALPQVGLRVLPMTLKTWTALHGMGSRLVVGGVPMEGDVRNFLWLHSRLFMDSRWYTVPTFAKWLALLPFSAILHRKRDDADYYCTVIALTILDIKALIGEVFADAPTAKRRDGSPAPGCLEAQLIHLFVREYGWDVEYIRSLPLARLIQLARQFAPDEDDAAEKAIKEDHLRRRNAELQAERDARKIMADLPPKTETA
jgi:hypothetical protein